MEKNKICIRTLTGEGNHRDYDILGKISRVRYRCEFHLDSAGPKATGGHTIPAGYPANITDKTSKTLNKASVL